MNQLPKLDNHLLYSLPFDMPSASSSTESTPVFPRPSPLPHSRSISTESPLAFIQRSHPSLDLYKTNYTTRPPPQLSEQSSHQTNRTPPSGSQRLPVISTSRKRSRSHPYSDGDDDTLDGPLPEDATEQEKMDWRRRQNTLAARKSRKRKQEQMQQLQDDVQRLSQEKDVWKERALMMQQLLMSHGLPSPSFEHLKY